MRLFSVSLHPATGHINKATARSTASLPCVPAPLAQHRNNTALHRHIWFNCLQPALTDLHLRSLGCTWGILYTQPYIQKYECFFYIYAVNLL